MAYGDDRNPHLEDSPVRAAAFSELISDLQDLSEMTIAIRLVARDVEKGLMGGEVPRAAVADAETSIDGVAYGAAAEKKAFDTNLVHEIRTYTSMTRENLQIISNVLNALSRELGGLGGTNDAIVERDPAIPAHLLNRTKHEI